MIEAADDFSRHVAELAQAMARYHRITLPRAAPGARRHAHHEAACMLQKLLVSVTDATADVGEETDESYVLTLPSPASVFHAAAVRCEGAGLVGKLRAKTAVGAYRGLETFSQLVSFGTRGACFLLVQKYEYWQLEAYYE